MSYKLTFHPKALKEWEGLDKSIREQFKKKLIERMENPKVEKDKLSGYDAIYKIKLRNAGFRLAYHVDDGKIVILVLVIAKRENDRAYELLKNRV